jgi:hypothetical protein
MLVACPALAIADPRAVFEPAERQVEVLRRIRIDLKKHDRTFTRPLTPYHAREARPDVTRCAWQDSNLRPAD